jgi:hypothetical protein
MMNSIPSNESDGEKERIFGTLSTLQKPIEKTKSYVAFGILQLVACAVYFIVGSVAIDTASLYVNGVGYVDYAFPMSSDYPFFLINGTYWFFAVFAAFHARKGVEGNTRAGLKAFGFAAMAFAVLHAILFSVSFFIHWLGPMLFFVIPNLVTTLIIPAVSVALIFAQYLVMRKNGDALHTIKEYYNFMANQWGAGNRIHVNALASLFHVPRDKVITKLRKAIAKQLIGNLVGYEFVLGPKVCLTPMDYSDYILSRWGDAGSVDLSTLSRETFVNPTKIAKKLKNWINKGFMSGEYDANSKTLFLNPEAAKTAKTGQVTSKPVPSAAPAEPSPISVSRGFEVAGDTFKFFVRIDNKSDYAITDVVADLKIPFTMKFDEKTPSGRFNLGNIGPGRFMTAIYYVFCEMCADEDINAFITYNDGQGKPQFVKMEPFSIKTCKFVRPREITQREFRTRMESEERKEISIPVRSNVDDQAVLRKVSGRLTMSTVSSSPDSLEMYGETRDGGDIGVSSVMREIEGVKTLVATVFGGNQSVMMGVLSDIMEEVRDIKADTGRLKQDSAEILVKLGEVLDNQMAQYIQMGDEIEKLQAQISRTNAEIAKFDEQGAFSKAEERQVEIMNLRKEMKVLFNRNQSVLDAIATNVESIARNKEPDEAQGEDIAGSNWSKIKTFLADIKEKMGWKEMVKRAAAELGKVAFKAFVSWVTGGIVKL